jgi:predicted secreted protein
MAILGTNIVLYYWNGSSNIPFAAAKNCTFDQSNQLVETTSSNTGWFKNFSIDLSTWTVKCDGLIVNGNFEPKLMFDAQLARTPISIRITIGTSPSYTIAGTTNIVSINNTGPVENTATYSISLQGTGRYTIS